MTTPTTSSSSIQKALSLLKSVKGRALSSEERKSLSIELCSLILADANLNMTSHEKKEYFLYSKLVNSIKSKAFISNLLDICFRSSSTRRIADQLQYLIFKFDIPKALSTISKIELLTFKFCGTFFPKLFIPYIINKVIKTFENNIILESLLKSHVEKSRQEKIKLNIYSMGEKITGNIDAQNKLKSYIKFISDPTIDTISIKITALLPFILPENNENNINALTNELKKLFLEVKNNPINHEDGSVSYKMIIFDAETYATFDLNIEVFKKVLEDPEFLCLPAGITLQSYLPDAFKAQKDLTNWALNRVNNGNAPIKITIVKGAYLSNEQIEASKKNWPQAPFLNKTQTDANFKKMIFFGIDENNIKAVSLGIATHNVFDISYALILQHEKEIFSNITFELFEGTITNIRRSIKKFNKNILVYCPVVQKNSYQNSISFLCRRIDEKTLPDNILSQIYNLNPESEKFQEQALLFIESLNEISSLPEESRRTQNRNTDSKTKNIISVFDNEPITDFSLKQNREWANELIKKNKNFQHDPIPIVIGGNEILDNKDGIGHDPSKPDHVLYNYCLATQENVQLAIETAKKFEDFWKNINLEKIKSLISSIAQEFRENRKTFIAAIMSDVGKTISEADSEISSTIDNLEYYKIRIKKLISKEDLEWSSKGTFVVISSRNFPCSASATGIIAALITGNCVIFKPAPDAILPGWYIVNAMWKAGIPKEALQFINCTDDIADNALISDERISSVIITGKSQTAKNFMQLHPGLDLTAITNGKNTMIITAMSDRDQAIVDLVNSAFNYSGQKYGSTSIAILEAEVYDDKNFMLKLKDAAQSLLCGPQWSFNNTIIPLIQSPNKNLLKGLTELEKNEEWLLEPKQDKENPNLFSPGIKIGVTKNSFSFKTPFYGPILSVVRAEDFQNALEIANSLPFGLSAGLHSLDEREHFHWQEKVTVGNYYINRSMTNAIIRREPFGGCKESSYGHGFKEGGPNFLKGCMIPKQVAIPKGKEAVNNYVNQLSPLLEKIDLSAEQLGLWYASIANYAYWWKRMRHRRDPTKIIGQDNLFGYEPRDNITLRLTKNSNFLDTLRVFAAALTCNHNLIVSYDANEVDWIPNNFPLKLINESEESLLHKVESGIIKRLRLIEKTPEHYYIKASISGCYIIDCPVLANGRCELLHYLREVTISYDYHRNGNLGIREGELRKQII